MLIMRICSAYAPGEALVVEVPKDCLQELIVHEVGNVFKDESNVFIEDSSQR